MFCSYFSDSRYRWVSFCKKQFGDVPSQIWFRLKELLTGDSESLPYRLAGILRLLYAQPLTRIAGLQATAVTRRQGSRLRRAIPAAVGMALSMRTAAMAAAVAKVSLT
jgi:hypothetical protein